MFDTYWESPDFRAYDPNEFDREMAIHADRGPVIYLSPVAITPLPFQARLLEELAARAAASSQPSCPQRYRQDGWRHSTFSDLGHWPPELLFVAHRQEILEQSQATFCRASRSELRGAMDRRAPTEGFRSRLASIQSLNTADLTNLAPDTSTW